VRETEVAVPPGVESAVTEAFAGVTNTPVCVALALTDNRRLKAKPARTASTGPFFLNFTDVVFRDVFTLKFLVGKFRGEKLSSVRSAHIDLVYGIRDKVLVMAFMRTNFFKRA